MLKGKVHFLQQSIVLDLSDPPYTMQDKLQSIGILTPPNQIKLDNARTLKVELYPETAPNTVNNFISLAGKGF